MAYATFGPLTAECGHVYEGYSDSQLWRFCVTCMRALREAMKADNLRRAALAASVRAKHFKVSKVKRLRIYERDGWICRLCRSPVDPELPPSDDWAASLDHIVCRSWGGDNRDSNLRLAHRICNALRGDEGRWNLANKALSAS